MIADLVAVAGGGALGSVFRYALINWVARMLGREFPYGTLVVNVLGSLLMGVLFVYLAERLHLPAVWRNLAIVGFLGGFTTFSAFSMETLVLLQHRPWLALLNILLSVTLCLAVAWLGAHLAQRLT